MAAEDAGTIEAELRLKLTQMEKDALQAQKMMDAYAKKYQQIGEKGGKMYVQGFGKAQLQMNQRLNSMVSSMQGVSPKMGALGDKMASVFSKPIFAMVPAVSAAFQAMLPIIGTIIAAVAVLFKGISAAAKQQKEFNDNVKLAKQAQEGFASSTDGMAAASKKQNDIEERKSVAMAKVRLAFEKLFEPVKKLGAAIKDITDKVFVFFLENLEKITHGLAIFLGAVSLVIPGLAPAAAGLEAFSRSMRGVSDESARAAAAAQKLKPVNEELVNSLSAYNKELDNTAVAERTGAKTSEQAARDRVSAADSYLQKLIEQRTEAVRLLRISEEGAKNNPEVQAIEARIAAMVRQRDEYAKLAEAKKEASGEKSDQDKIYEARQAAIGKYEQAVRKADDARKAGLIDDIELQKQKEAALAQEYADMEAIVAQYKLTWGETVRQRDALAAQVKLNQDIAKAKENQKKLDAISISQEDEKSRQLIERRKAQAESAKSEGEKNRLLDEAIALENDLIDRQRKRAWDAIKQSEEFKAASKDVKDSMFADFNEITAGMKKVQAEAKKIRFFDTESFKQSMEIGQAAISAFDSISDSMLEVSRKHAEEQIAIVEAALKSALEQIEAARQAELEAKGFAEASTEENIQAQIDRAKEAGDEVLQYKLERRKEEMEINKRYDAQAKAAEEKAAKEKADIEFKVAKEEYDLKLIQAVQAGIMATINALANPPGPPYTIPLAAIAGSLSAVQIGLLAANPPKPPKFASGGIVPGNSYAGDKVPALVNSGELILNRSQQDNVAGQLSGGYTQLTVILQIDSRELAQSVADVYGSGQVLIPVRGIA